MNPTRIQLRYDTLTNWTTGSPLPTLAKGEVGIALDGSVITAKVGTSDTPQTWNNAFQLTVSQENGQITIDQLGSVYLAVFEDGTFDINQTNTSLPIQTLDIDWSGTNDDIPIHSFPTGFCEGNKFKNGVTFGTFSYITTDANLSGYQANQSSNFFGVVHPELGNTLTCSNSNSFHPVRPIAPSGSRLIWLEQAELWKLPEADEGTLEFQSLVNGWFPDQPYVIGEDGGGGPGCPNGSCECTDGTKPCRCFDGSCPCPDGESGEWTPQAINTGNTIGLWLDAAETFKDLEGTPISQWRDISCCTSGDNPNQHTLQSVPGKDGTSSPNISSVGQGLNGLPVVEFNGSTFRQTNFNGASSSTEFFDITDYTFFMVARNTGTNITPSQSDAFRSIRGFWGETAVPRASEGGESTRLHLRGGYIGQLSSGDTSVKFGHYNMELPKFGSCNITHRISPEESNTDSSWYILAYDRRENPDTRIDPSRGMGLSVNGEAWSSANRTSAIQNMGDCNGVISNGPLQIGGYYPYIGQPPGEDSSIYGLNGSVAEVIAIRSGATIDQKERIEGYLAHKWGLTSNLPNDHPYKNSPPTIGGTNGCSGVNLVSQVINETDFDIKDFGFLDYFYHGTDLKLMVLTTLKNTSSKEIVISGPIYDQSILSYDAATRSWKSKFSPSFFDFPREGMTYWNPLTRKWEITNVIEGGFY